MKVSDSFMKIAALRAELAQQIKTAGEEGVKETLATWLAENPGVEAVRWAQYAPAWNDGEACIFSVHEPEILLAQKPHDVDADDVEQDEDADREDDWLDSYADDAEPFTDAMSDLNEFLSCNEDILEAAFGDGYQITVDREKIEVEEYEHD